MAKVAELAHKLAHKKSAPRARWTHAGVIDELRAEFFLEIERTAPEVLHNLRENVWPEYRRNAPLQVFAADGQRHVTYFPIPRWPESLRRALSDWARGHFLTHPAHRPADWAMLQAAYTLSRWTERPQSAESEPLRWWVIGGYSGMEKTKYLAVELPPRIERSIYETGEEFDARVWSTLKEIVSPQLEAIDQQVATLPLAVQKRRPEHFTWLVRYQLTGESPAEIAAKPAGSNDEPWGVDVPAVKDAIRKMARIIGITLRLAGKPGRPKSTKTTKSKSPKFPQN